jgi:hypothetical protein
MAYLGTPIDTRNQFQSLQGKRFNGDGSTTAFTLDVAPSSVLDIEVFVGNVRQDPNSAYTLSGTTLTFTGAPPSGTNNIYVVHQAKSVGTIGIPDDTISARTLVTADSSADHVIIEDATDGELKKALYPSGFDVSSITGATALATQPAATDEIVISDGGTLKRLDIKHIQNTPAFCAYIGSDQTSVSDNTATLVSFNAELFDSDSTYTNTASNYKFTPAIAGKYFISAFVQIDSATANVINEAQMFIYKNGSAVSQANFDDDNNNGDRVTLSSSLALVCDDNDYIQVYAQANVNSGTVNFKQDGYFTGFRLAGIE